MNSLERFRQIAHLPLRQWNEAFPNYRPVGIYNAYVPEELFHAAGLTPVYVFHRSSDQGHTRTHLPSFACWPSRSLIDQGLSGDLDGLAGMAFAKTCDTVQALADIWRKAVPGVPVYHFGMPVNLAGASARPYLNTELELLRQSLGGPSDDALRQAHRVYNRTRELVGRLYERAADLKPTELFAVLRASLLMPKELYNNLLTSLLEELPETDFHGPRLILVGPHLSDQTLFQVIENAGARVVDDLLDVGHRHFGTHVDTMNDPIGDLTDWLLGTPPTPTKYDASRRRDRYLAGKVAERNANGVVFARQKFCDPHGFDYANTIPTLDIGGIPHLLVELEQAPQTGQMQTRIQAFLETLAA